MPKWITDEEGNELGKVTLHFFCLIKGGLEFKEKILNHLSSLRFHSTYCRIRSMLVKHFSRIAHIFVWLYQGNIGQVQLASRRLNWFGKITIKMVQVM